MTYEPKMDTTRIGWLLVKVSIIALVIGLAVYKYREHREENRLSIYTNIDAIIVSINDNTQGFSQDKFHTPMLCNKVLFKKIDAPLYVSLTTCNNYSTTIVLDDRWVYNHRVGDTVHFDAIKKHRFFNIADKYVPKVK
jgi:hypothetical protein